MELVDIDAFQAKPLQAAFNGLLNMRRARIVLPHARSMTHPAYFGRDDEIFGIGIERFGNQFFRNVRTVRVSSVNKVDAEVDGAAQSGQCAFAIGGRSPDTLAGDAHSSIAHAIDG